MAVLGFSIKQDVEQVRLSNAGAIEIASALNVVSEPSAKAALSRALVYVSHPELELNDQLGVLCIKLGYGATKADRIAFAKAECHAHRVPGLCLNCYHLHPSVDAHTANSHCSSCQASSVVSGRVLVGVFDNSLIHL